MWFPLDETQNYEVDPRTVRICCRYSGVVPEGRLFYYSEEDYSTLVLHDSLDTQHNQLMYFSAARIFDWLDFLITRLYGTSTSQLIDSCYSEWSYTNVTYLYSNRVFRSTGRRMKNTETTKRTRREEGCGQRNVIRERIIIIVIISWGKNNGW